jgi:hypothetical protein
MHTNGLTHLLNAVTRLATAFNGLAETVETVNTATRQRLLLDAPAEPAMPMNRLAGPDVEEAAASTNNGRSKRKQ